MQTKPLALYVGAACFVMAGIAGATWASFRSTTVDRPLFVQSGEVTTHAPTVDWPAPSATSGMQSVAYLKDWMALVSPVIVRDPAAALPPARASDKTAAAPQGAVKQEEVKDMPDQTGKEKRSNSKTAASQRQRHERDAEDNDGERIQTTGRGTTESEHSGQRDRRSHQSRRARQHREDEDDDRTVGLRYRREPPQVRVAPAEPRGAGLFGIFDGFQNGW